MSALLKNHSLAPYTWFRTGGKADFFFRPSHLDDLKNFLKTAEGPISILGGGSNMLIRDGGVYGNVIKLGSGFRGIEFDGNRVKIGAGVLDRRACEETADKGLSGLEFMIGIPGTIGGAIVTNAGAHGCETKDVLESIEILDREGNFHVLSKDDLSLGYRSSHLPEGAIILSATFVLQEKPKQDIKATMKAFLDDRNKAQPLQVKTGGSTFKNPVDKKAWELIDKAGFRGYRIGDAKFSEKHCNFIVNVGVATASEIEELGELARSKVYDLFKIKLEWEIHRVGRFA